MSKKRPSFRKSKGMQAYESPEELFGKLPNRAASHGYLRAPQVDTLREYVNSVNEANVALELPTGTGKTLVGLLIAEWRRRRSGEKVAYLTLTNQLAGQILEEAVILGIECADLRGGRGTRSVAEEGRYLSAQAIGVSVYSNLFNVNPVIKESDVLVFDDAHGGESYLSNMWTVQINAVEHSDLYIETLTSIRPALSDAQYATIENESNLGAIELADSVAHPEILFQITELIDEVDIVSIRFPWTVIRSKLSSCLIFVSSMAITIRPLLPPTHTHVPFSGTTQRIFMSATLGGEGDLMRGYGVTNIKTIRAQHPQWGKRYIFTPGLYLEDDEVSNFISKVWNGMADRRLLLLAPSFPISRKTFSSLEKMMDPVPTKLEASDIEYSLESFTEYEDVMLCLAGRYDGLDLPGDDCRLLLMVESPGSVGTLERYQRAHWKLGPLLRRRERTRLIQGMGRCTRDATDFAVIILVGQSLTNSITTPAVTKGLPGEIQREINWGISQGDVARDDVGELTEMVLGLLSDEEYRKEANESLEDEVSPKTEMDPRSYDSVAKFEVQFNQAFWDKNYSRAYDVARSAVDQINSPELEGYRAWWFYLASLVSNLLEDIDSEQDCLRRARATGVNAGYLDYLLRKRNVAVAEYSNDDLLDMQAEMIWSQIESLGWQGPKFSRVFNEMLDGLQNVSEPPKYHVGLERLGKCIGAETIQSSDDGVPDVVWILPQRCYTLEAKSDKKVEGKLSKKDVQQAQGHPNWVVSMRDDIPEESIRPIIISPTGKIHYLAEPHIGSLYYISTVEIETFAKLVFTGLISLRTEFSGKEYGAVLREFKVRIKQLKIDLDSISALFSVSLTEQNI